MLRLWGCSRVGEQDSVRAEDVPFLAEELDLVQIRRQVVGRLVPLPVVPSVVRAEDRAAAADRPRARAVADVRDVEDAVAA